jgi:tRNA modification GTPase
MRWVLPVVNAGVSIDLIALDVRPCLHYLGEITTDDRLDYIFSKFCIGK